MNLADFSDSAVQAKTAFYAYLALPDAAAITSRMRLANSASEAVELILDAKNEAWRIRLEMAKDWDEGTMARVGKMLDAEVGEVPFELRHLHPITGPLMKARFPDGAFAKMREKALLIWQEEHERKERRAKKKAAVAESDTPDPKSAAAKKTNREKERGRMTECVRSYVKDPKKDSQRKYPGMSLDRSRELLGTLTNALKYPIAADEILEILNANGFKNATHEAVEECMTILKNEHG